MNEEESKQSNTTSEDARGNKGTSETLASRLDALNPFVERTAKVTFDGQNIFTACLVSSFVKSFEFVRLTCRTDDERAFFLTASLRSIAEETILLNHISHFCHEDREFVLLRLMELEVKQNIRYQRRFFRTFRPFQPVMPERTIDEERIKDELKGFWRKNGWPRFQPRASTVTPPTREIAEKSSPRLLEVVYDFIYRLSSNSVHFRPGALLRMGWGPDLSHMTFSPKHISEYYRSLCQVYGCYLLCLYFELFDEFLTTSRTESEAVAELRKHLLWIVRWPEMVTFEEMNFPVPSGLTLVDTLLHGSYVRIMEDGFIAGTKELRKLSREGRPIWPTYRLAE